MINLAYIAFLYILLGEVIVFFLLVLPTPSTFKSKLIRAFMGSDLRSTLMWVHLALCIFAGLFFLDLVQTQTVYSQELQNLRARNNGQVGTEVRIGFLSYQIQKTQRNKQITMMLILASIAINLFIRMLYFIYKQRGDYDGLPDIKEVIQAKEEEKARQEKEKEEQQKLKKEPQTPENPNKDIQAV